MENNEFKKVNIKNSTCCYFGDIIKLEDFDTDNISIDKTLIGSKALGIRFDKIDWFIRIYDGTRYLTLFNSEIYIAINDRIKSKKWHHIYFSSLFPKSQGWFLRFFAYRKNIDFA